MLNARSVKQQAHLFELSCLLSSGNFEIVAITETWANETLTDAMLVSNPANGQKFPFSVFRKDRSNVERNNGGGVCLLIHDSLTASRVSIPEKFENLEVVSVDVSAGSVKHRVICVYRPAWQGSEGAGLLCNFLDEICDCYYPVTVVGDFNLAGVDWSKLTCKQDGVENVLLDSFLSNSLYCVSQPTRNSITGIENVLDLVFMFGHVLPSGAFCRRAFWEK